MKLAPSFHLVAALALICFAAPPPASGQIVCTASIGYHCETDSGCESDATYISTYEIDWENGILIQSSVQHTKHDASPRYDATKYAIIKSGTILKTGEFTITAVGDVGTAAVETLLIGEQSYLSSSVSNSIPRIFVMMGRCEGFVPDGRFPHGS